MLHLRTRHCLGLQIYRDAIAIDQARFRSVVPRRSRISMTLYELIFLVLCFACKSVPSILNQVQYPSEWWVTGFITILVLEKGKPTTNLQLSRVQMI